MSIFVLDFLKMLSIKSSLYFKYWSFCCYVAWKYILLVCGLWFVFPTSSQGGLQNFTLECWDSKYIACRKKIINTRSVLLVSRGSYILTLFKFTPLCSALHPLNFSCKQFMYCFNSSELTYVLWQVALHLTMWIWLCMSLPY